VGYWWFMWLLELAGFMTESPQTHLAFSHAVFIQLGSSTVYVVAAVVPPCASPNFQSGGNGAVS